MFVEPSLKLPEISSRVQTILLIKPSSTAIFLLTGPLGMATDLIGIPCLTAYLKCA